MSNSFEACLAGRVSSDPVRDGSSDGQACVRFRVAVPDRAQNPDTGSWETTHTAFHDVAVFGVLAERARAMLHAGDPVLVQGEFRFRSYESADGRARTSMTFVATRIGPDILLADVVVTHVEPPETIRTRKSDTRPSGRRRSGPYDPR